jgi:putative hemolysin
MPVNHAHEEQIRAGVLSKIAAFPGIASKFAPIGKVRELYRHVQQSPQGFHLDSLLEAMRVHIRVDAADQSHIPGTGPVVVVANQPHGMLDGAVLAALLTRMRPDVKVLTNFLPGDVPELQQHCIFVDPFQTDRSVESNRRALREAFYWLESGGMLAIFPAGDVSHWHMPVAHVTDPAWNHTAVRLIRKTGAAALPVYFCGHNSIGFQLLGMMHPTLRTAFLLNEFLQHEGKSIEVRIGTEIPHDVLTALPTDKEATEYLRWRTYLLGRRVRSDRQHPFTFRSRALFNNRQEIAPAEPADTLSSELVQLPQGRTLAENADFAVYLAKADEIPHMLREVGRLREVTFRKAGEGTGEALDLDRFDDYYWHLLLWCKAKNELVGAYRAGYTDEILPRYGVRGLYTNTLFRFDKRLFEKLGPAMELGRSFVRPEYQRQYAPLFLLWKGIARLVTLRPDTPVLFGAVSISNDYSQASREMIYRFFESRLQNDELAGLVEPRRPFRPALLRPWDCRSMCHALRDVEELSQPITDVEPDRKGLPILLRQYAKIGGKMLAFNVDRKFSNVLDGLVVVDLRQTEPAVLERYMGREGAARFRQPEVRV